MSLFQQSEISLRVGKQIVLDSSGLTDSDTVAAAKAERAIRWAFKKWNLAARWDWLRTLDSSQTTTSGTTTYNLPYDFGSMYDVRLGSKIIKPIDRRIYDRATSDLTGLDDSLQGYDLLRKGTGGLIEFLPSVGTTGTTINLKYFRKLLAPVAVSATGLVHVAASATGLTITVTGAAAQFVGVVSGTPISFATASSGLGDLTITAVNSAYSIDVIASATSVSASGVSATAGGEDLLLDIPSDYVEGLLSLGAWYYLVNKGGEARGDRIQLHKEIAAEVLREALRNNNNNPDAEGGFLPPAQSINPPGPDATWPYRYLPEDW